MNKPDNYAQYYPKPKQGIECKKTNCERHESYAEWRLGNPDLKFCMECKYSHVSQYKPKQKEPK